MYLVDTNVVSEARKGERADLGVQAFFAKAARNDTPLYVSVVTVGELRRGVELIRHRGDDRQASMLETWLNEVLNEYGDRILGFDAEMAQVWGKLRVPQSHHALDKQIAATALVCDLTVATRNTGDFAGTGVRIFNPFAS